MSSSGSHHNLHIERLELADKIHVHLSSGDVLVIPYEYTHKLGQANYESLKKYHLIGGGIGIHFDEIDEDISLKGIILYKREHELLAG